MSSDEEKYSNITLFRGWKGTGSYVWSPFVTKVEARLRFSRIPYHVAAGSPRQSPRGKIPYIELSNFDSAQSTVLSDSTLIINRLVEDEIVDDLNSELSPVEKAHDLALRALLEDKYYFYQGYEKWHDNYYAMRDKTMEAIPYPIRVIVGLIAYHKNMQTFYGQGTSRFSPEEITCLKEQVWVSINALLEESKERNAEDEERGDIFWALGEDTPTEFDAVLFGFIVGALVCTAAPETQSIVKSFPTVVEYARNIHDEYFPEYALWD